MYKTGTGVAAGGGGALAFTGFPYATFLLIGLALIIGGLVMTRLTLAGRPAGGGARHRMARR